MDDLWRSLRIGDRVRIVSIPHCFAGASTTYHLDGETRELYEHLVAENAVLTVNEIDDWEVPWIDYSWVRNGIEELHSLGLNHYELERVP